MKLITLNENTCQTQREIADEVGVSCHYLSHHQTTQKMGNTGADRAGRCKSKRKTTVKDIFLITECKIHPQMSDVHLPHKLQQDGIDCM